MYFSILRSRGFFVIVCGMEPQITYRGKVATTRDIEFINKVIADNPTISRRALSQKLCRAWDWVQPNGALRDMVCRGFLLTLERSGHIKLPPPKCFPKNPLVHRSHPKKVPVDKTPLCTTVSNLKPLEIRQVRRTPQESIYNSLIADYHYLGYCHPVGEHVKYIVFTQGRPIACFAFSSAPRHIGCRDKFIGWSPDTRKKNLHLIAYNTRFLILPWIKVSYLASHLLGRIAKVVAIDWQSVYGHPIYFLETFVDTEKFRGTCYRAANWKYLGLTTGRGKNDNTHKPNRSIKAVYGYGLVKDFQDTLCQRQNDRLRGE